MMMSPAGFRHGQIVARLTARIATFVEKHELGCVVTEQTGFILERDPDTVRAPDVAFVASSRLLDQAHHGYFDGAPDLAVEVLSPSDDLATLRDKAREYLGRGSRTVWLVDPASERITVIEQAGTPKTLGTGEVLSGGDVLTGFELRVDDVFA